MTALVLMLLEDPSWPEWMTRALDRPEPGDLVARRTEMRVASEVARAAQRAGRRPLLDAAARRFATLARRWPARDAVLEDESLNPVAIAAEARIGDDDVAGALMLLLESGTAISDRVPGIIERIRLNGKEKALAEAALGRGADPHALGEFLLQHFGRSEVALDLLEKSRTPGDAREDLRLACLRFRSGQVDKSLALAREGLSVAKEPGVRESLILLLARFELRGGRTREAQEILAKPADSSPARAPHFAELLDAAGDSERASKLYAVAEAQGWRPHIQLARLHQRAGRYEEALYRYECDLKSGSLLPAWPGDEDLGPVPLRPGAASSSSEGRAQMLKALGR